MNRANYSPTQGLTYRDVEEKRRREIVEHNSRVFAKEIVGVHGHELPKFAESAKTLEYWKLRENFYNPTPNNASSLEYQQQLKYWAKPDELRLSDVRARPGPIDPLKYHSITLKVHESKPVAPKPSRKEYAPSNSKPNGPVFNKQESVYDDNPAVRPSLLRNEQAPLFSSFSPDQVFKEPYPDTPLRSGSHQMEPCHQSMTGFKETSPVQKEQLLNRLAVKRRSGAIDAGAKEIVH